MEKIGSMMDLLDRFRTEEDCVEHLYEMKVENVWTCPRCGCHSCSLLASRRKEPCTCHLRLLGRVLPAFRRGSRGDRAAHIRSHGWSGVLGGLKTWRGLDQRVFDAADDAARLPVVHHVISNFKAPIVGTYHGVTPERLQGYMDEFCWRYNHRGTKGKFDLLLDDLCACSKRPKAMLLEIFATQSPWPEPKVA